MWPYWAVYAFFSVAALLAAREHREQTSRLFLLFTFLVITLFVGLRFDVGADWDGYLFIYERLTEQSLRFRGDIGFYTVMLLSREAGWDIWVPNLIFAAIFAVGLTTFAKRQANFPLVIAIALPYLIIAVAMSGVRQAAALGVLLLAFNAFARERYLWFALLVLTASMFHASAAILLGVGLLANTKGRLKTVALTLVLVPIAYYLFSSSFDTYFDRYKTERVQSSGALIRVLMNFVPATLFLLNARAFGFTPQTTALWRGLAWVAFICLPLYLVVPSSTALDRLAIYLIPLQLVVFSNLPNLSLRWAPSKMLAVASIIIVYGLALATFFSFGVTSAEWLPYRTWIG